MIVAAVLISTTPLVIQLRGMLDLKLAKFWIAIVSLDIIVSIIGHVNSK